VPDGLALGEPDGKRLGEIEGKSLGEELGLSLGDMDGLLVGSIGRVNSWVASEPNSPPEKRVSPLYLMV